MSFNNFLAKISVCLCVVIISACSSKQVLVENPELEAERLKTQTELERFEKAIAITQTKGVDKASLSNARTMFDDLYKNNPSYLGALLNSADISFQLDEIDKAKDQYLNALTQLENSQVESIDEPSSSAVVNEPSPNADTFKVHALNQLGLIERRQGQFEQAEDYYRKALKLAPDNTATLKNLAILLDLYRGQLAKAYALYQQYQQIVGDADPKVKDWLYDLKNRLPAEEVTNE